VQQGTDGRVSRTQPRAAGDRGQALEAATAANDLIEVAPIAPLPLS